MVGHLTSREFTTSSGVEAWRVADGGACAWFPTDSFAAGVEFVRAIAGLPGVGSHPPDVDLRPDGVMLRLFTTAPAPDGLSVVDLELARRIGATARERGMTAEPSAVLNVVINVGAFDVAAVVPFWRAVLGYGDREGGPVDELNDPRRRKPVVCFHRLAEPREGEARIHLDIWVPHDVAQARVDASLAAGGRLVTDRFAPSWWVLADPESNEACVATWIGTDGLGYPEGDRA